jgi:hypothetical protein
MTSGVASVGAKITANVTVFFTIYYIDPKNVINSLFTLFQILICFSQVDDKHNQIWS